MDAARSLGFEVQFVGAGGADGLEVPSRPPCASTLTAYRRQ